MRKSSKIKKLGMGNLVSKATSVGSYGGQTSGCTGINDCCCVCG